MAQWYRMSLLIQHLPDETFSSLYPPAFPIEVRHFLADWIESQIWDDFTLEKTELHSRAQSLLEQTISMLHTAAQQNTNVVDKMKLAQIGKTMVTLRAHPLQFGVLVKEILKKEQEMLSESTLLPTTSQYPQESTTETNVKDVDHLVLKVLHIQDTRKKMHQLQEDLNWERQNYDNMQAPMQQNGQDPSQSEMQKLLTRINRTEYTLNTMAEKRLQHLQQAIQFLDICQNRLLKRLKDWKWEQQKSTIGFPFDDNLNPMQTWCEQLIGVNLKLRQEVGLTGDPMQDEFDKLEKLMHVLIQSSLVVERQPPQVIKTQSKFSSTVRYLLGEKIVPGKPAVVKAQIINELQARNLSSVTSDNVGELINNTAILEHNVSGKNTCASFRNMSIRRIKRADRKGSESVTEEKFTILFSMEIHVTGWDTPFKIQVISLPVVIIVHGSQDNNALATIIWDCAFSEPDRVPFVVPERVSWRTMAYTLNSKFTSEVQTQHNLDQYNQHFLAQKIFDKHDFADDFSNMMVSWAQFNKEVLPGRSFTFWQWFEGVIDVTKRQLKTYWSEGLIFGFIGKQHLHVILKDRPNGTFLLRFSDSEIGAITIAYVAPSEGGGQRIQNIQPFTKRDLEIRSLGDRICDINEITHLYPDFPKHVFKKFCSEPQISSVGGYIPVSLQTVLPTPHDSESTTPSAVESNIFPLNSFDDQSFPVMMDTLSPNEFSADIGTLNFPSKLFLERTADIKRRLRTNLSASPSYEI